MKLKPCPFCGKSPVVYWPNPLVCCIQCKGCLAEGPLEATERGAQIKWNKRAANTSSAGTTDEAKVTLDSNR